MQAQYAFAGTHLLAATPPAKPASDTIHVTTPIAALIATAVLILILYLIGRRISHHIVIDDILRVLIAFFGIVGVLTMIPLFKHAPDTMYDVIAYGVHKAHGNETWIVAVMLGIAAIGLWIYSQKGSWGNLVLLIVLSIPLLHVPDLQNISVFYANNVGRPMYDFFAGVAEAGYHKLGGK